MRGFYDQKPAGSGCGLTLLYVGIALIGLALIAERVQPGAVQMFFNLLANWSF